MNNNVEVPESNGNELEEVYIPNEENTPDDDQLDDVVPCELVTFDNQPSVDYDIVDSSNDGFYDDNGYTPSTSIEDMVDITSVSVDDENSLEEEDIPNEENTPDDDQLDDIEL